MNDPENPEKVPNRTEISITLTANEWYGVWSELMINRFMGPEHEVTKKIKSQLERSGVGAFIDSRSVPN